MPLLSFLRLSPPTPHPPHFATLANASSPEFNNVHLNIGVNLVMEAADAGNRALMAEDRTTEEMQAVGDRSRAASPTLAPAGGRDGGDNGYI